jgi:hypothetical protein
MNTSIILAKIFGPYCLIVATGVLLNQKTYQLMMENFLKNSALIYFAGILALMFGLILIQLHNIWVVGWPIIITILSWVALIKGIWLIVFPNTLPGVMAHYQKNPNTLTTRMILVIIIGIILTTAGYRY